MRNRNTRRGGKNRGNEPSVKIIPLGGLNEVGKNITVLEYGDEMLLIDCGMTFPGDDMYGIDIVIPDMSYLVSNKDKIRGLIVTHGHEDHIGAIPYLLKRISGVPIYGTPLTLGLIGNKLKEHGLTAKTKAIKSGDHLMLGSFRVEVLRMTHSVADAVAFAITTPAGVILHTGDFKIDYTPLQGEPIDLQRFAEIGRNGVLLLMADSTNAQRRGYTPSEQTVAATLEGIFAPAKNRIIVATFASNVDRIQQIIDLAVKYKRKVAISGRSMVNIVEIASQLGYLRIPDNTLVDINRIKNLKDEQIVIVTTGSQGEPMSALTRMASNDHKSVQIRKGSL